MILIRKIGFFPSFYFWENRLGDVQERKKKTPFQTKNKKQKKKNRKISIFQKGSVHGLGEKKKDLFSPLYFLQSRQSQEKSL